MVTEADRLTGLDLLVELSAQISAGRSDITALERVGFSAATGRELANIIDAAPR
jgi:hypothetical protein